MKQLFILSFYIVRSLCILFTSGGAKSLMAENIVLRQQLLVVKRSRSRAPNLTCWERLSFAGLSVLMLPTRFYKAAIIIKPATLLKFHKALIKFKYHLLFSNKTKRKPGPKGPSPELIKLIIEMKKRNPRFGCTRIAMQIHNAFGIEIKKDVLRRVLIKYYNPGPNNDGPSWLSFIATMTDSLWSLDMSRCESVGLKSHWIIDYNGSIF